jgi:hypothetical protein
MATCFTDIIKDFDHDILTFQETMKKYYTNKFFLAELNLVMLSFWKWIPSIGKSMIPWRFKLKRWEVIYVGEFVG